jgi:hypothetical protein
MPLLKPPRPPKPDREHVKKRKLSTTRDSAVRKSDDEWGVGDRADSNAFRTVLVGDKEVELIHGEHPHSRMDNTIYARYPDGRIEDFDGHYALTSIEITESNYLKTSGLSGNEVRKACDVIIKCNGEPIYKFFTRTAEYALRKAQQVLTELAEHPAWLFDNPDLVGRKVYWYDQPGTITMYDKEMGEVYIEPEAGKRFRPPAWMIDGEDDFQVELAEGDVADGIKDDILSPHIWWFRD